MSAANKKSNNQTKRDAVHVKYVRKARLWCRTLIEGGIQRQEWSEEKP